MSQVVKLTNTAAEAIRAANHDTLHSGHLTVPDIDAAIANLAVLADRLDQLLRQLAANIEARHQLGGLALDELHGTKTSDPVEVALDIGLMQLTSARHDSIQLAGGLHRAHNIFAHVRDHGSGRR